MMANHNMNYELQAPIFTGEEYIFWQVKVTHFLITKGIWNCIIYEYEEPKDWSSLAEEKGRSNTKITYPY